MPQIVPALLLAVALFSAANAGAQTDRRPSHCIALAEAAPGIAYVHQASFRDPLPNAETVRLHYIDHSMFLLQTEGGIDVVTDYAGFISTFGFVPDVVTMNRGHSSHWTPNPDPAIGAVLRGWGEAGSAADHHLDLGEILIRNVTTDIRGPGNMGDSRITVPDGNSIFVFEVAGLCIGHLGHLHHEPTPEQYAALGRLDVVMAAVDGGLTLDQPTMVRVLSRLRSALVIPMHWFGRGTLESFLAEMSGNFEIVELDEPSIEISLRTLPDRPTITVLRPRLLTLE